MGIESAVTGGLISGVGSLVGSAMTNDTNEQIASSNNATAIELANTAHQREVKDLKAAGLNPILSAGGSGAATPSLTSPTITNALGDAMSAGITNYSALQTSRQADAQIDKMRTEARLNDALTLKAAADTSSSLALARNTNADTDVKNTGAFGRFAGGSLSGSFSSSARDLGNYLSSQIKDLISGVHVNSAKKAASSFSPPSSMRYNPNPHDGSVEHLLPVQ